MTREHIFARWLVREVHGGRLLPSDTRGSVTADEPVRIARFIAAVCAECNAGWMSGLEMSFRRALFVRPRVGVMPAPDRTILSRWFTKTALLLAHAHAAAIGGIESAPLIVTGMPEGVEVFLARRRRPRQPLDFALDFPGTADARRVRMVALLVDDLVAHVAPRGTLASPHGTRLWPLRSHTMRWDTLPVITPLLVPASERARTKARGRA